MCCVCCVLGGSVYLGTLDMLLVMCAGEYMCVHVCVCVNSHASHSGYRLRGQPFSKDRPQRSWNPRSRYVNGGKLVVGLTIYVINTCSMTPPPKGTVMSNTYGLAKKATAIAVRVLDANGSGTTA